MTLINFKKPRSTGAKNNVINWSAGDRLKDKSGEYLPKSVDLIAKCVGWHRTHNKSIKCVYLCPVYYNQFDAWWRRLSTEQEADSKVELLTFDGCEVKRMNENHVVRSRFGDDIFDWEMYE